MNEGLKKFAIRNLVLLIAVINYIPSTLLSINLSLGYHSLIIISPHLKFEIVEYSPVSWL